MTGRWFCPGTPDSSTNKTDHHDIIEILLKVVLNTINLNPPNLAGIKVVFTLTKILTNQNIYLVNKSIKILFRVVTYIKR